jgi:spermidine/putrescine transport system substrate-binding protein/spermidine/putrescine transport system permease protein
VLYDEATTPEEMYTKYKSGAISYDLICTSEYVVKKLMDEGELLPIEKDDMEYYANMDEKILKMAETYDPGNVYAVPYFYGTVGILYDTSKVKGDVDSWSVLFDKSYSGEIIMQNSIRDAYMCALKYLGYSLNDTDEAHLLEAQRLLLKQKPDVEAYFVDEVREEMVAGNATLAVCYSGEAYLANEYDENLNYVVPKEGSNLWIDSWVMTKRCGDTASATAFLDYLCREDVAMTNFEEVYYPTPNLAVYNELDEEIREDELVFPPEDVLKNCEVYETLPDDVMELYGEMWKELKVY